MAKRPTLAQQGAIIEQLRLQLAVALGDIDRLTRERDAARANVAPKGIKVRPQPVVTPEQERYRVYRDDCKERAVLEGLSVKVLSFAEWQREAH